MNQVVIRTAQGGRVQELYASFVFAYSMSKVLLSLVWHITYCVNFGIVEDREA